MLDSLPDAPRTLRLAEARDHRRSLLRDPHIAPLSQYVEQLRQRLSSQVPDFDPQDGGVNAKILFLFEKPGPMTDELRAVRSGSGFISRNNDDQSAEATFRFMDLAGLARIDTVIWNVIPWWDGLIRFTGPDRLKALSEIDHLLRLLPRLHTVVLVGRTAGRAAGHFQGLRVVRSAHPSPRVRSTNRPMWDEIPHRWREAGQNLDSRIES